MFDIAGQKIEVMALMKPSAGRPQSPAVAEDWDECAHWMGEERAAETDVIVWGEDLARIPLVALKGADDHFEVVWVEPSLSPESVVGYVTAATVLVRSIEIDNGVAAGV